MNRLLRLGTRGSALALAQARWVAHQLACQGRAITLTIIRTTGDRLAEIPLGRIGAKGIFVSELEEALLGGHIDLAVHSLKDLPAEMPAGLLLGAIPPREDPRDSLVGRTAPTLAALRPGALVATSSQRRQVLLRALRPDLGLIDVRGNVETRLRKLDEGQFDALCLAAAGLHRLGLAGRITEYLDPELFLPAPGQGALAIQVRADDPEMRTALAPLHDPETARAIEAERHLLAALGGGCSVPCGALATSTTPLILSAVWCTPDGELRRARVHGTRPPAELAQELAAILAADAILPP
jgi:hydroxymethylbilane synthase